jgi:hypothetical protein
MTICRSSALAGTADITAAKAAETATADAANPANAPFAFLTAILNIHTHPLLSLSLFPIFLQPFEG